MIQTIPNVFVPFFDCFGQTSLDDLLQEIIRACLTLSDDFVD